MQKELEKISSRFLQMENCDETVKENILFATKKLWKRDEDTKELKLIRALKYIFDQMKYSVPSDPKNLIYLILNVIFFNKKPELYYLTGFVLFRND